MLQHPYQGPIKAVVVDWAGTVIDYGSCAPAAIFVALFKQYGVSISTQEARLPMGLDKRTHIKKIFEIPEVGQRWQQAHGRGSTEQDVDELYKSFVTIALDILPKHADLIPGTLELVKTCRHRKIKIGSSTGYASQLMTVVTSEAARQGFSPDAVVCADEVPAGRPAPWMCFENARRLDIYPMAAMVKVDDTPVGIESGLNAGMWTVGVIESGNEIGLSLDQIESLFPTQRTERCHRAEDRMNKTNAHFIINSVAELPAVLDAIEVRLTSGERP